MSYIVLSSSLQTMYSINCGLIKLKTYTHQLAVKIMQVYFSIHWTVYTNSERLSPDQFRQRFPSLSMVLIIIFATQKLAR